MSKLKLNSIILCDRVDFDENHKVNIYGIFDNINAPSFPALHPSFTIFVHMDIEPGEHKQFYEIKREEDNNIIFSYPEEIFKAESNRHQLIHRLKDFLIEKEGKYIINIYIDGKLFATNYFLAQLLKAR